MTSFDFRPRTRVIFGAGEVARLGEVARDLGGTRCLLVADQSLVASGYVQEALRSLKARRMEAFGLHDLDGGLTSAVIDRAASAAAPLNVNLIVGLGDHTSIDCARGINFIVTNGGSMKDYWGYGRATRPLLPMIAIPVTAGSGCEARTSARILDSDTGLNMTAGDAKAAFRAAILDPDLTASQPAEVAAATGYDALAHAIETLVSLRRTALSDCFAFEAWRLLNANFERTLSDPGDLDARGAMLAGAHFAGLAVEHSTLGAAHACAYAISERYDVAHGAALALVLRHVVAWNLGIARAQYENLRCADLPGRLRDLAAAAKLPGALRDAGVPEEALPRLAEQAAAQWVGRFNPQPFDREAALEILRNAYS